MNLLVGQKVKVKEYKKRPTRWNSRGLMDKWMGRRVTIIDTTGPIKIEEDTMWDWREDDFESTNIWKGGKK